MEFWDVVDETVESVRNSDKQSRKDERMAMCMKVVMVEEKDNGGRKINWWRCKDPRCPNCNKIRGQELRTRIEMAVMAGYAVYYLVAPIQVSALICKNKGRDNYIRIPNSEKEDTLFFTSEEEQTAQKVNNDFIASFDWTECARKKSSRIQSGYMAMLSKEEKKHPFGRMKIEVQDFVAGPHEVVDEALEVTIRECIAWKQPDSVSEAQRNRDYFNGVLFKNILSRGGKIILSYKRTTRVHNLNINWMDIDTEYINSRYPTYYK